MLQVSVIVPVYNGAKYIRECLNALVNQSLPRDRYEVIVVDDGSTDATRSIAQTFKVNVLTQDHGGQQAAQNLGWQNARGKWIALIDADAIASRMWLYFLLQSVEPDQTTALGAAGRIVAYPSEAPASRFITLSSGLNTEAHLKHPVLPYAPLGNVLYRREALVAVNGFDERFSASGSAGPDLHHRLLETVGGEFYYEPRAIVLHHHRETWQEFWRQQKQYGYGYAQVLLKYRAQVPWSIGHEIMAWLKLIGSALRAPWPGRETNAVLLRRGLFVRDLAQRLGFDAHYYSRSERTRWS